MAGLALIIRKPPPDLQYAHWMAYRQGRAVGFLDRWPALERQEWFRRLKQRAHLRLTGELLHEPDYAFVVAHTVDRTPELYGHRETWPLLLAACRIHFRESGPQRLEAALRRVNTDLGGNWELTFLKSAETTGRFSEVEDLVRELRTFTTRVGGDPALSDSLRVLTGLFPLSTAELARARLGSDFDPQREPFLLNVLRDRKKSLDQAFVELLNDWKSGSPGEPELPLVSRFLVEPRTGAARVDLLEWMFLSPTWESYRKEHFQELTGYLEGMMKSDPAAARRCVNRVIRGLAKATADLPGDWLGVTEYVVGRVAEAPDLTDWIDDARARDFTWTAFRLRRTDTLVRAVRQWPQFLNHPSIWVADFIRGGENLAACVLIEARPHGVWIDGDGSEENEARWTLADFRKVWENLPRFGSTPQSQAYIRLLAARGALENLPTQDRREAREELADAVRALSGIRAEDPEIQKATNSLLVRLEPENFALGRPFWERSSGGQTFGAVAEKVYRGTLSLDGVEAKIWKGRANQGLTLVELSGLPDLVAARFAGTLREEGEEEGKEEAVSRLGDLLGVDPWDHFGKERRETNLVGWIVAKLIEAGELKLSVEWLSARMKDYRNRYPGDDDAMVLHHIWEKHLRHAFKQVPVGRSLEWLGYALDGEVASGIRWPDSLNLLLSTLNKVDPEPPAEIAEAFENAFRENPLREWLLPEILLSLESSLREFNPNSDERFRQVCFHVDEPWLVQGIEQWTSDSRIWRMDVDRFENELKAQPRELQEYLWRSLENKNWKGLRHPSGRELTEDERLRLVLSSTGNLVERAIHGKQSGLENVGRCFERLLQVAESHSGDERVQALLLRVQRYEPGNSRPGVDNYEKEHLVRWRDRLKPYLADFDPVRDLRDNEGLPVTERVWRLVQLGRARDAAKLMKAEEDKLDFFVPPTLPRSDLTAKTFQTFPESLPEGSGLRSYARAYLDPSVSRMIFGARDHSAAWPVSRSMLESVEGGPAAVAGEFDRARFKSWELEQKVFSMLSVAPGTVPEMRRKVQALGESNLSEGLHWRLALVRFSGEVESASGAAIRARFVELVPEAAAEPDVLFEMVGYGLWRRALLNQPMDEDLVRFIQILALSPDPMTELIPGISEFSLNPKPFARTRFYLTALVCALEMLENPPARTGDWAWSDFPGLFEGERGKSSPQVSFLQCVAGVAAARCVGWDEEARWNLLGVFQKDLRNPQLDASVETFFLFRQAGSVTEEESERRLWSFAERYPANGRNFLAVAKFGVLRKDEAMARRGLERAREYAAGDATMRMSLENLEKLWKPGAIFGIQGAPGGNSAPAAPGEPSQPKG